MVRLTRLSPKPLAAKSELGREGGGTVKAQRCKAANRASKHLAQSLQRSQKNNYPNLGMLGGLGSRGILNLNSRVLAQYPSAAEPANDLRNIPRDAQRPQRKLSELGELVLGGMNIRMRDVASESRSYLS